MKNPNLAPPPGGVKLCPDCNCPAGTSGQYEYRGALCECLCDCHDFYVFDQKLSHLISLGISQATPTAVYSGRRYDEQGREVWEAFRDGEPLRGRYKMQNLVVQWGNEGGVLRPGGTLLAWALCVDVLGEDGPRAHRLKHRFADHVVSVLPDTWSIDRYEAMSLIHILEGEQ